MQTYSTEITMIKHDRLLHCLLLFLNDHGLTLPVERILRVTPHCSSTSETRGRILARILRSIAHNAAPADKDREKTGDIICI